MQTYVPWNLHEPEPGVFHWEGHANLTGFLATAAQLDLGVLLRAGPYICGEWDFGGLPWWLGYPAVRTMHVRTCCAAQHACAVHDVKTSALCMFWICLASTGGRRRQDAAAIDR